MCHLHVCCCNNASLVKPLSLDGKGPHLDHVLVRRRFEIGVHDPVYKM